jgi:signal transduction histidine kinase
MSIRLKLFILFFALGLAPVLLLSLINHLYSVRAIETLLRGDVERDARGIVSNIDASLLEREATLIQLARTPQLRDFVREASNKRQLTNKVGEGQTTQSSAQTKTLASSIQASNASGKADLPESMRAYMEAYFQSNWKYYAAITCLDTAGQTLFRLEPENPRGAQEAKEGERRLRFQTEDFLSSIAPPDSRVWKTPAQTILRSAVTRESFGASVRYTVAVFTAEERADAPRGALVVDVKLENIFREAAGGFAEYAAQTSGTDSNTQQRLILILDGAGNILHHSNPALKFQHVSVAMPGFKAVADQMIAGRSGHDFYTSAEHTDWLTSYRPIQSLGLRLATAGNYSGAVGGLQRTGWLSLILSALAGLATALLLTMVVRRTTRSIERVTEGAVAIAAGNLEQRIEVRSSDETRLLAESFNRMTDRLREQIAREAETRQFESFLRLSAMLTHDLKNAIASLSLLVRNMEHQFDNAEFRVDAMKSLTQASDKLRALVMKLSEPVRSMSGEHGLPRPTDLIPLIKRVMAATAEPTRSLHEIETHLPNSLVASVEADRMEKVIENLILNALEAMGAEGGKLTVEAGPADGDKVFFGVTDTGPGMSEEFQRTRLFRPFATTKRKGVGLGLYTCREVVRAHGGDIEVESQKGVGSCFRVVLPSKQITDREFSKSGRR